MRSRESVCIMMFCIDITDEYNKHQLQQPHEEAHSQEAPDDNSPLGGNTVDLGGEENTGLQVCY